MAASTATGIGTRAESNRLRKNSLGVGAIVFLVVSAAAPLTAIAGGTPLGMLLGSGPGFAGSYLVVSVLLLLFAVGYVAMARRIGNAGAFYSFVARGLGGELGGAAALVAILSYNTMQIGVMGMFGAQASSLFALIGIEWPWWVWSFIGIALVAVFGYRRVDLSAKVLTVLVLLEYVIVVIVDVAIVGSGGDSGLNFQPFTPSMIFGGETWVIGVLFAFAAFIGFEATTIYAEEARTPETTIPRATYISVLVIGVFYIISAWAITMGAGVDKLVPEIGQTLETLGDPTQFVFGLAARYTADPVAIAMQVLLVTSLFAGVVAFHNAVARYMYVAGREKLLPASLGVTHPTFQSPHVASILQTIIAVLVVGLFAVQGLDPVLALFSWLTNVGTLGIIVLMAAASLSVACYFGKHAGLDNPIKVIVLPVVVALAMMAIAADIWVEFGSLAGAEGWRAHFLPGLVAIFAVIGLALAFMLKSSDRAAFDRLGEPLKD
jgi:amino acid transporter